MTQVSTDMLSVKMQGPVAIIRLKLPSITKAPVIEQLTEQLLDVAKPEEVQGVVVDFKRVTQAATPLLSAMMKLRSTVRSRGGNVALSRLSPELTKVIRTIGLNKMLPVYDSINEAVRACR